jgi:hypothetical protein
MLLAACTLVAAGPPVARVEAQGVRGEAQTLARYITIQPLQEDTVAQAMVTTAPDGSLEYDGHPVTCITASECLYYRSLPTAHAVTLSQDVSVTAWGLGISGLSATALLRARADLGGDFEWPRSNDPFDALLGYLQLARSTYRIRLGRQQTLSDLGFSGFDGASVEVDPRSWLSAEVYGGRSLAQGLDQPRNEALQGIEDFVFDQSAYLIGGALHGAWDGLTVGARYERDIWADRSALLSERASVDAEAVLPRGISLDGSLDYDFAFDHIGKAHLTAQLPVPAAHLMLEATVRRYLPYFELWTIWGYFSPVAYREGELRADWRALPSLSVWASGSWRHYDNTDAPVIFEPLKDRSTRLAGGLNWSPPGPWGVEASYTLEEGFGAVLNNGEVSLRWVGRDGLTASAYLTAFQQIEEFRVGSGAVAGGGVTGTAPLFYGAVLQGGIELYRNAFTNRPSATDWNQFRAYAGLRIPIGHDPGMVGYSGGRP